MHIKRFESIPGRLLRASIVLSCLLLLLVSCPACSSCDSSSPLQQGDVSSTGSSDETLAQLFRDQKSDVQVEGLGTVARILSDDTEGSEHQKFILELASGQTLLIAHNTDLAPRLDGLREGDTVEFFGVYEYSDQGGTVHWTHKDPDGSHTDGWLKWNGQVYE